MILGRTVRRQPLGRVGMLGRLEVQEVLPSPNRGPRKVFVRGWPGPIPVAARTELPPEQRRPVYGPAAREEARRLMREAARERINLGWPTKISLCRVAKAERALGYSLWKRTCDYLAQKREERRVDSKPLLRLQLGPNGAQLTWRTLGR